MAPSSAELIYGCGKKCIIKTFRSSMSLVLSSRGIPHEAKVGLIIKGSNPEFASTPWVRQLSGKDRIAGFRFD